MFDREPDAARGIVAGFVDPTGWSLADEATFRLAAAEAQALWVRPIEEPGDRGSWLAQRDVDGSLVTDLQSLGALDDGRVDHLDEARLLQLRLDRAGIDAAFTTLAGDHTTAVGQTDDPTLIDAALEATGSG